MNISHMLVDKVKHFKILVQSCKTIFWIISSIKWLSNKNKDLIYHCLHFHSNIYQQKALSQHSLIIYAKPVYNVFCWLLQGSDCYPHWSKVYPKGPMAIPRVLGLPKKLSLPNLTVVLALISSMFLINMEGETFDWCFKLFWGLLLPNCEG